MTTRREFVAGMAAMAPRSGYEPTTSELGAPGLALPQPAETRLAARG